MAAAMQMLPPPEERLYASFGDLHYDLKKWTLAQGYALSIDSSSNRDATGVYRRYNMSCIKGGKVYKPSQTGKRNSYSKKTGCLMRIKCTKQDGWPWNGRWRVTVMHGEHNHPPFNPDAPEEVPPAFRHVEGEGLRWLLIMHREAQLNLRQLTIGLRTTFGDKYKFVKKADVSNMLSKVRREEERELAKRPPGAPPLPPGTMTAFMAALLNPVPDPYANGVRYETVQPENWPSVPNFQSTQQHAAAMQQPPQYTPRTYPPGQHPLPAQPQYQYPAQTQQQVPPQQYAPHGQAPHNAQVQPPVAGGPGQVGLEWRNYGPPPPPAPGAGGASGAPAPAAAQNQTQQQPSQPQQPAQQQHQHHHQPQPHFAPIHQPASAPGPTEGVVQEGPAGRPSVYRPTSTLQPIPVAGIPGAVVMPRSFSPVSEDESDGEKGGDGENGDEHEDEEDGEGDSD